MFRDGTQNGALVYLIVAEGIRQPVVPGFEATPKKKAGLQRVNISN
jgi:hypothetical protein